jgi:hypothetical protein
MEQDRIALSSNAIWQRQQRVGTLPPCSPASRLLSHLIDASSALMPHPLQKSIAHLQLQLKAGKHGVLM